MITYDDECLDTTTWFDRMERFATGLCEQPASPARHIRKAYHLHCLAPEALKPAMPAPLEEDRMEAMLECGAYESAVASLIGPAGQVTVRNGDEGGIQLAMRVSPDASSAQDSADTWPMALLEAWAASFLRLRARPH